MYEIRKINILDTGKYCAVSAFIVSLIPSIFYISIFAIFIFSSSYYGREVWAGLFMLAFPLGMAVAGFLAGIIFAVIYNLLAPRIGGIKMDLAYLKEDEPDINQK